MRSAPSLPPNRPPKPATLCCSQVAWYSFAHTWGWNTLEVSGAFIDRGFAEKGEAQVWSRCVSALSTEVLRFDTLPDSAARPHLCGGKNLKSSITSSAKPSTTACCNAFPPPAEPALAPLPAQPSPKHSAQNASVATSASTPARKRDNTSDTTSSHKNCCAGWAARASLWPPRIRFASANAKVKPTL